MSAFDGKDVDVLLVVKNAPQPSDKGAGPLMLGLGCCIVKGGLIRATYYAPGCSWDPPVLFAECCARLLDHYLLPGETAMVHATGLAKRVRDVANSTSGTNAQGRRYAGLSHLRKLAEAHDTGRMAFRDLDTKNFTLTLPISATRLAATQGREEALGMASFMRTIWGTDPDFLAVLVDA